MNPQLYTQVAQTASERYLAVLQAFRGMLFAALSKPYSGQEAQRLRQAAMEVAHTYLKTEETIIATELHRTALDAVGSALSDMKLAPVSDLAGALEAFLEPSERHLRVEIGAQLTRDVEALLTRYREFAIQTQLTASAVGGRVGASTVAAFDREKVRFYFKDRAGRLYPSQKFVRTLWRQSLVTLAAEYYLMEAASRGATAVVVEHTDPNHRYNGTRISISSLGDDPDFLDVRDDIFHPNSDATLKVADVPA